jgi:hypothetical protein
MLLPNVMVVIFPRKTNRKGKTRLVGNVEIPQEALWLF